MPSHTIRSVDDYLQHYSDWRGEAIRKLRQIILSAIPDAQESIRWLHPFYELHGPVCFTKAYRTEVRVGFWRGDQLDDPLRLLFPPNDPMRSLRFTQAEPIDHTYLSKLLTRQPSSTENQAIFRGREKEPNKNQ